MRDVLTRGRINNVGDARCRRRSKSTVHRLLDSLRSHGFVEQVSDTKRYRLGHEVALLGWSVAQDLTELQQICESGLTNLANGTGDTAFLFVRSGHESICLDRRAGTYPVKAFTVDVGVRRPLGIGAAGIAFLALMSKNELRSALGQLRHSIQRWPVRHDELMNAVRAARENGYAMSDGFTVPDVRGLAKVVRNPVGDPVATLGIAAISSRINQERLPRLLEKLSASVEEAEDRLSQREERRPRTR